MKTFMKAATGQKISSLLTLLRNYRIPPELNKLFYASGIGKHDKSGYGPTFSTFYPVKTLSPPRDKTLPGPPGVDYSTFCPFHRYAGHIIEEYYTLCDAI
ncbi:hypothetical protein L1987_83526 [Smallanthus sonchifolius]|uniref:Uncharacterized protein n=1 Tax=Smallanthus sonchifolius TaxID=185202 RepID=A0ACB8YCS8_9ASTR|nr:hypothetical protein L1987_83526 [Smallanthus sonchifolius]